MYIDYLIKFKDLVAISPSIRYVLLTQNTQDERTELARPELVEGLELIRGRAVREQFLAEYHAL